MPLNNLGSVVPRLWRCAQPDADGISSIFELGVSTIFKLNTDNPEEQGWCDKHGLKLENYPLHLINDLPSIMTIVGAITEEMKRGEVIVHCLHGIDRTGLIIAAWRILNQGWTVQQADVERKLYGVVGPFREMIDAQMEVLLNQIWTSKNQPKGRNHV